jgi:outer membrane protein assembly factor BamC
MVNPISIATLGLCLTLSGCSVLEGEKIDYKSAGKVPSLEVPPDLTQLAKDPRYAAPAGVVSASGFRAGQTSQVGSPTAVSSLGDVRIERAGSQRWLVVSRPADKLWDPVRDFWKENGFLLIQDQPGLGIMETDWAENRAKIPQDFIRNTLGKLVDALYSTGERDKFRTRLERNTEGGTEIYISHRGMVEVYSNSQKDSTAWQPRAVDPELEAEFLRRLMVKLGASQEQSKAVMAVPAPKLAAVMATANGIPVIQLSEPLDRAWRRVGLSLDRTGFTVEDRDRSKGIYFVRYVEPSADKSEPSLLGKLFGGAKAPAAPVKHRIVLTGDSAATTVSVQSASGANEASGTAQQILKLLADDLK